MNPKLVIIFIFVFGKGLMFINNKIYLQKGINFDILAVKNKILSFYYYLPIQEVLMNAQLSRMFINFLNEMK